VLLAGFQVTSRGQRLDPEKLQKVVSRCSTGPLLPASSLGRPPQLRTAPVPRLQKNPSLFQTTSFSSSAGSHIFLASAVLRIFFFLLSLPPHPIDTRKHLRVDRSIRHFSFRHGIVDKWRDAPDSLEGRRCLRPLQKGQDKMCLRKWTGALP
jgi:hypothetical protein